MEVALAAGAGFFAGLCLGTLVVGHRYVTALEQLRDVTPGHPVGQVFYPPAVAEGEVDAGFDPETVDRGAKHIQAELAAAGRHIGWEEAQAQARAMLAETMPLVR